MGYEVIDERGSVTAGPASVSSPGSSSSAARTNAPEPYDLGELEPVGGAGPAPDGGPPRGQDERSTPRRRLEQWARMPAVLGSAGLLAGSLLGGYVVHQNAVGAAQARDRSVVQAIAVAENQLASGLDGVRVATMTVRLSNFGPEPLQPVLSAEGHRPSRAEPLVDASRRPVLAAAAHGGSTIVTVTVPLPCDSSLGPVTLPVRTADQQVHLLDVATPGSDALEQDRTMCFDPQQTHSFVSASLAGTVQRPFIRFTNSAAQARRVWLQTPLSDLHPMPGVTITLSPSMPQDVEPMGALRLDIRVRVDRCIRDVTSFESAQLWLGFIDTDIGRARPPDDSDWQNVMGTSIGSVVTAAMLEACR